MNFDDILKEEPIDIEKDIDKSRLIKLDYDITAIFMDPTQEIEPGHFIIDYSKEEVEKRLEKFKDVIQDYNKNEMVAYIFWQKMNFLKRVAGLLSYIEDMQGQQDDDLGDLL